MPRNAVRNGLRAFLTLRRLSALGGKTRPPGDGGLGTTVYFRNIFQQGKIAPFGCVTTLDKEGCA